MKPIYTMRYRPVSSFTLPPGISTEWVRIPQIDGLVIAAAFPELERSKHPYGEFTASRELTDTEMDRHQVQRVDPEHLRAERVAEIEQRIDTLRTERTLFTTDADEVTALSQMIEKAEAERDEALAGAPRTDTGIKRGPTVNPISSTPAGEDSGTTSPTTSPRAG